MSTQHLTAIITALSKKYSPHIALNYHNHFELLVAVVLSAQCTDKRVNIVTAEFFPFLVRETSAFKTIQKNYPWIKKFTPELIQIITMATLPQEKIEHHIRSTGFYKNKAANLKKTAQRLLEAYQGQVPDSMQNLLTLPGVARKSANVILHTLFNKHEGVIVDTHVKRIAQRLRLIDIEKVSGKARVEFTKKGHIMLDYLKDASPEKIEQALMRTIPKQSWGLLPNLLVKLGRDVCIAQRPRCHNCVVNRFCPVSRV